MENIDQAQLIGKLFEEIEKQSKEMLKPNIIIVGKSGVGKSTLINNVFRGDFAETGVGRPVTQHTQRIEHPEVPVVLYDTKGLELKEEVQQQIRSEIIDIVNESRMGGNDKDYIHAIWYCVSGFSNRIEETEIEMIKELSSSVEVPIIMVITQSVNNKQNKEFISAIRDLNLNVVNIIPIMAEQYEIMPGMTVPAYGLDKLVEVTYKVIPESVQKGFVNAQKVSIAAKEKAARKYANAYVAGAFATGFVPIPMSDAPVLIADQVGMIAHITVIFGISMDKAFLTSIVSALLGTGGATVVGKTVVSNLLKCIPGVGTVVGGLISGSTAAILTAALARAYIKVMVMVSKKMIDKKSVSNEEIFENISEIFKKELKSKSKEV